MAGFLAGNPTNHQIMNGGLFSRKTHHLSTYDIAGFLAGNPTQSSNYEWQGVFCMKTIHLLV